MAKTYLKIFLAPLILIFLVGGCYTDISSSSGDNQPGFDREKLIELSSYSNEVVKETGSDNFDTLMIEMEEFKSFTDAFFRIWSEHIDKVSPVLDSFNRNDISLEEKTEYAYSLAESYRDFKHEIGLINPPPIAVKAYDAAVKALTYRILFFEGYTKNIHISELNDLENKAYLTEALFWEELDKIYKYFEEMIDESDNNGNLFVAK
jgi:hypothetical protein